MCMRGFVYRFINRLAIVTYLLFRRDVSFQLYHRKTYLHTYIPVFILYLNTIGRGVKIITNE